MDRSKPLISTIALLMLSPAIGELLSSSSPPAEFFRLPTFLVLIALYGCGALLVREIWVEWGGGPYRLLLLGAAYGILEEGIMTRSFFSTTWPDLGLMAWYGRWLGVNWVWTTQLTIYHAVFSMAIPIMLIELAFPGQERRLGRKGALVALMAFAGAIIVGLLGFRCNVPVVYIVVALISASGLILAAKRYKGGLGIKEPPSTFRLTVIGSSWGAFLLLSPWILAKIGVPSLLTFLAITVTFIGLVKWAVQYRWDGKIFDIVSSPLWAMIIIAFIQEFVNRPNNTTGMSFVAIFFAVLLLLGRRKIRQRGAAVQLPSR